MHPISRAAALTALSIAVTACAAGYPRLEPASGADGTASVVRDGVSMTVATNAWHGDVAIRRHVVPIRITLENRSDRTMLVRYEDLKLVADDGEVYRAVPPFEITGSVVARYSPRYLHHGFHISRYHHHYFPRLAVYSHPLFCDHHYHARLYDTWVREALPTRDMLEQALPEGVLDPGGTLAGFVYFEAIPAEGDTTVELEAELVDANREVIAAIEMPFNVRMPS